MNTINLTQEYIIEKYKLDKLEKCLDRIEDDFANKINNGDYKTSDSYFEIVLRSTAKSLLTFRELILLCKNGLPDGALGLSRNITQICLYSPKKIKRHGFSIRTALNFCEFTRN